MVLKTSIFKFKHHRHERVVDDMLVAHARV